MCEQVVKSRKRIHDKIIPTYRTEIISANVLEVEAGSTGYCGGDSGHGGRTYFRICDLASTDMHTKIIRDDHNSQIGFEVSLGGDTELDTMIDSLKFILSVLEGERGIKHKPVQVLESLY